MNTSPNWNAGVAGAVAIVSFPLLLVILLATDIDSFDAALFPALVAFIFSAALASVVWNYSRGQQPGSAQRPVPAAIRARRITPDRWRAGLAAGVALLSFPLLAAILLWGDFDSPRSSILPAALAFIFGAALASVCWSTIAANVRVR